MIISVIMPVYNGEKHLREAIESILNQTYTDFEFIIINDGSTDTSEEIILSYSDERIVYVKNSINLKLIKTLNRGVDIARGKYIARMDADDIAFPTRFETQLNYFNQYPDLGIVNGRSLYLYSSGKVKSPIHLLKTSEAALYIHPFANTISHPTVMVLSGIFKNNNYRDESIALHIEDWELWLRLYSKGIKFITSEEPLLYYRITDGSINRLHKGVQIENMSKISFEYLKKEMDFVIKDEVLRYILGDEKQLVTLKELLLMFRRYLKHIQNKFNIDDATSSDIKSWVYYFCLKDLKRIFFVNKVLFLQQSWFFLLHFNHKDSVRFFLKKRTQ